MRPSLSYALLPLFLLCISVPPLGAQAPPPPPPPEEAAPAPEPAPEGNAVEPPAGPQQAPETTAEVKQLRQEVQELRALVRELQRRLDSLTPGAVPGTPPQAPSPQAPVPAPQTSQEPPPPPAEAVPTEAPPTTQAPAPSGGGRALLLPDISLIGSFVSHLSNDRADPDRNRIFLRELELGLQSYVYPGIKADAFIVMPLEHEEEPGGGHSHGHQASVEEAYLTLLQLGKLPLSLRVGKSKVPFGRVNQLHPHSWAYIVQPTALANLVSDESLAGQGAYLSWLIPTRSKLFLQLDAGLWNSATSGEIAPGEPVGSGAAFRDRFGTARLWSALPLGKPGELELGLSHAWGRGQSYVLPGAAGSPAGAEDAGGSLDSPRIQLFGTDVTFRRYGTNNRRFLLRGEYLVHRHRSPLSRGTADGWYLLADQRFNKYSSVGLLYDRAEYPFAPGLRTHSLSGIVTRQLTEQTYLRAQLKYGDRPDRRGFTELWLQWVWGMGPHTHNLE